MTIGAVVDDPAERVRKVDSQRRWHLVDAGKWFGTACWFRDGIKRIVKGERVWRCGYAIWGSSQDGDDWGWAYAYDEAAWPVALANRSMLANVEKEWEARNTRTPT